MPAMMYRYQLRKIDSREGQVLGADHQRHRKLPSTAGIEGIRKKKTITMPCMVKKLVVSVGLHQVARRSQQLQPDQQGEKSSNKKEEGDGQ
jgi:hypothetical protein